MTSLSLDKILGSSANSKPKPEHGHAPTDTSIESASLRGTRRIEAEEAGTETADRGYDTSLELHACTFV